MRILVDSNILIDIFTEDPVWFNWSAARLNECIDIGRPVINQIIYAEASQRFEKIEEFDKELPEEVFDREDLPWAAGFLAGKAFLEYRGRGGQRRSPLPDFYIGAHAAIGGMTLLTRDPRRYRAYFSTVKLICPD